MYLVRDALPMEVFRLVEISEKVLSESTYAHMKFDKEKTANYIFDGIKKRDGWFLRVIVNEDRNEIVGGLLCICEPTLFGPDKVAYDITIMMDEEHRGRCVRQLVQVVDEYKSWAIEQGAKLIKLGVSSGINIDKASLFFEQLGFKRIGAMHGLQVGV